MLFSWRREPILPVHTAHLSRRSVRERVTGKQQEHVSISMEQTLLRAHDDRLLPPRTQRRKPQIPIESRLIRRVDPRWLGGVLRFESKRVNEPGLSIVRALELDFVTAARHHGEQSIAVRDTKWLQHRYGRGRQRQRSYHPHHFHQRYVENPRQHPRGRSKLQRGELCTEFLAPILLRL